MELIPCPACSQPVSPAATACPKCGHPIAAQSAQQIVETRSGCMPAILGVVILIATLFLLGKCRNDNDDPHALSHNIPAPRSATPPNGAFWRETGRQGLMRFVVIDNGEKMSDDAYITSFANVCGAEPVCTAHFWTDASFAANRLPMTDEQLAKRVAVFVHNSHTGHHRLSYACSVKPGPDCVAP